MDLKNIIWEEKYRPKTVDECILPTELHKTIKALAGDENFPSVIMHGVSGVGKTTTARAIVEELGLDYIIINGSLHGNIDTLRNEIKSFASTVSFVNKRKVVILDEADGLNVNSTQKALRNFMDEFKDNCGFILTCNNFHSITTHLHSRCSVIEFKIPAKEKAKIASRFFNRCMEILDKENVTYEKACVAGVITKYFPDFRRILNELQTYSRRTGTIDSGILTQDQVDIKVVIDLLKRRNFSEVRNFVSESVDDYSGVYDYLYEGLSSKCVPDSIPDLILIIAKYQYQAAFVASQEINLAACLIELMTIEYK
ncbi:MAG: AAA family ATPase [Candidatus Levybacteria bacterium]|nr:AAA family ATPase [Candidatus Levybacteria bacterium]